MNVTNKFAGEHLSGKGGSSNEFSDYRNYAEGDDIRNVDWNIFARLNKAYVKQFHLEEERHIVIIIDSSNSMLFEDKFLRAQQLAAAFGVIGLYSNEKVSVYTMSENGTREENALAPCQGRASLAKLFHFIENIKGGGEQPLESCVADCMKYHKGKGVAIVLSDFLTFGDINKAMNQLFSSGLEIFALQLLSPTEIDPEVNGDIRLIDMEFDQNLDVSGAGDLLGLYQEYRLGFEKQMDTICRKRSGRFIPLSSASSAKEIILNQLVRKGWLK